jgi:NAD(P)-dependent dehydrogenase (short-subunit alcohol dehydrogenase family)
VTTLTAVVTGAASPGYARGITNRLLTDGYNVIGTYQSEDKESALEFGRALSGLDLREINLQTRSELAEFVASLADTKIQLLVNAQYFWNMEDPDNFDHDSWDQSIAVNLTARNFLLHELKHSLVDGAAVVSITSTEGFVGSFGGSAYAAARAAEHNLIKSFANTLGKRKIRVNAIATGWIGSVMDTDDIFNRSREITPLGRLGTPEEVADVVAYLSSPGASFINGHVLVADGGYTCVDTMAKYEFEQSHQEAAS